MRWQLPIMAVLAVLLTASCQDGPVEPTGTEALLNVGNSPDNGMELIWSWTYLDEGYTDFIPCFNGGNGELVTATGYLEFWGRIVETPSGNVKQHGELRGYENYVGQTTGDVWLGSDLHVPTIFYNTGGSQGETIIHEPVWIFAENQRTGEVVRMMWRYHQVLDAEGEFLRADVKILGCRPFNGRVR